MPASARVRLASRLFCQSAKVGMGGPQRLANGRCLCASSYDFNQGVDYGEIMKAFATMGYQGTNLGEAIEEIKRMVRGC